MIKEIENEAICFKMDSECIYAVRNNFIRIAYNQKIRKQTKKIQKKIEK